MTQEEKAKAYDDALKRAKAAIDIAADKDLVKGVATTIFPELRESEDEKIINAIIGSIKDNITLVSVNGYTKKDMISYLEKQKEQKSLNISDASEWLRKNVCRYMNSEYNEFHKCVEYDGSIDKEKLINDFEEAMQKEQKPAEQNYDNRIQYDSIKSGIEAFASTYSFNIESKLFPQLTKEQQRLWREEIEQAAIAGGESGVELSRDNRYKENRTIEWSEEDETKLRDVVRMIEDSGHVKSIREHYKKFLTSLPERFNLQPKQEWSEEDEKIIERIVGSLYSLKCYVQDNVSYSEIIKDDIFKRIEREQNWLKSLLLSISKRN